jgi:hypothetical protein
MDRRIGKPNRQAARVPRAAGRTSSRYGASLRWDDAHDGWPGPVRGSSRSGPRLGDRRRPDVRPGAAHWLFREGGICPVLLLGLIAFPLIAKALGFR